MIEQTQEKEYTIVISGDDFGAQATLESVNTVTESELKTIKEVLIQLPNGNQGHGIVANYDHDACSMMGYTFLGDVGFNGVDTLIKVLPYGIETIWHVKVAPKVCWEVVY